jgi:hypothetical protein
MVLIGDRGAPFLAGEAGRHFGQELWQEVVDETEHVFAQPRA